MSSLPMHRIAGAPISWGVCEAPDWGHEIAADRVLSEMRGLALAATELGPTGYLGAEPAQTAR
jgi:inosose dehydratase